MESSLRLGTRTVWITLALVTLVGLAAGLWLEPSAEAQLGGHSQVTRLELRYTLGGSALEARFHLATGLAVDQRINSPAEIGWLLQAAEVLAGGKARMFAVMESGQVKSWQLSVP